MKRTLKLFAMLYNYDMSHCETAEVIDLAEAERISRERHARAFTLHEQGFYEINGLHYAGERMERPGIHYVNVDKVLTRDEVLDDLKRKTTAALAPSSAPAVQQAAAKIVALNFAQAAEAIEQSLPANARFIPVSSAEGDYLELTGEDTVYDRDGQLIWPDEDDMPSHSPQTSQDKPPPSGFWLVRHL